MISFTDTLVNARREPDGIAWTPKGRLVTANEGTTPSVWEPESSWGAAISRSSRPTGPSCSSRAPRWKRRRPPKASTRTPAPTARDANSRGWRSGFSGAAPCLFVGSERGDFVAVYRFDHEDDPELIQLLPTGDSPEGLLAIPNRGLFVTANEGDGTLSIFEFHRD